MSEDHKMTSDKPDLLLIHTSAPMVLPGLEERFVVHRPPEGSDPGDGRDAFVAGIADRIRALMVSTFFGADADLINALPNLEIVINGGGHYDSTDVEAVRARGLPMTYTPQLTTEEVADHVISLLLHVARRMCEGDRFVRAGNWLHGPMGFGTQVHGKRFGIVGLGHIGRAVGRRAEAFDLDVCYNGPRRKDDVSYRYYADLAEMAAAVDFMAVTCCTAPDTRHIVDGRVLQALGGEGLLVNVARQTIDQTALIAALEDGTVAGAGLDVFESEPDLPDVLLAMENVVLTPHMASSAIEAKQDQRDMILANLDAHFAGQPLPTPIP
jgi:lactate dehydrogenase-like 2-hydroxyacid dehydrogenase